MFLPENREMAASFRQSYKAARLIAAEYNVTHGRPKIPEKIVQRSKSSAGLRSGKKKKHNFRSTQNLHTKVNVHKALIVEEKKRTLPQN